MTADVQMPQIHVIGKLKEIPLVECAYNTSTDVYKKVKESNGLLTWTLQSAEGAFMTALEVVAPVANKFQQPIQVVDDTLCKGLDVLQEKVPIVKEPPAQSDAVEKYLAFKTITLIPFEPNLIELKMLSPKQVKWLNDYYLRISNEVGAELKRQGRMEAFHWMISKVKMIPERAFAYGSASTVHDKLLSTCSILIASLLIFFQSIFLCD